MLGQEYHSCPFCVWLVGVLAAAGEKRGGGTLASCG